MPKAITAAEMTRRQAVGRRILQALAAAEVTQAELAQRLGTDQSTVSRLLIGTRRSERFVAQIAQMTGTSASWLRTGSGAPVVAPARPRVGRRPASDQFLRRLDDSEARTALGRATEVWALPGPIARRVLDSTIRALGLRTAAAGRHRVLLVIAPTR